MKKMKKIFRLVCCTLLLVQLTSCGLIDFDVDSDISKIAAEMKLNFDTAYVWKGFVVNVIPQFKPDSLNITDIYVRAEHPEVVDVNLATGRITAVGAGWTRLFVESVSAQIQDTCTVCVMEPWELTEALYPYETVFYADVTVRGEPLNENMMVAAFVGDECRCIGEALSFHGIGLMQLRVGAENVYDQSSVPDIPDIDSSGDADQPDPEEDEEGDADGDGDGDDDDGGGPLLPEDGAELTPDVHREVITFRCYDKKKLRLYECPVTVDFDGETHGTLSNLYKINFE